MFVILINNFWSILSIFAQILTVALIVVYFSPKVRNSAFARFFKEHGLIVAFIASFLSMIGSLIYSNVIGYAPCTLCWYQRIFMYPQVFLMAIAIWKKDQGMKLYGFILSVIGAIIALYHYFGQIGLTTLPCPAIGYSVSCSQTFVLQYGYITIPMMAFSAFILIAATFAISLKKE